MYLHMCFKSLDLLQTSFQFYNVTWTKTIKHIHTINKTFTNAFFNNSSRILTSILITRSLKLHETPIAYLDCCCNQIFWWTKISCKWKSGKIAIYKGLWTKPLILISTKKWYDDIFCWCYFLGVLRSQHFLHTRTSHFLRLKM